MFAVDIIKWDNTYKALIRHLAYREYAINADCWYYIKKPTTFFLISICSYFHLSPTSRLLVHLSVQFSSVAQSGLTLCDPMNHSTPGLPVHHQLPEFTQTHVHRVSDVNNGILLSHKISAFKSVLMRWMNLESIIESEVSQKEKDKYRILTHIYRI